MGKLWGWLAIFGIIGIAYLAQPDFFHDAYAIIMHGDISALAEYLRSFGAAAILVTIALFVVMTFTIVFPFMILSGAAGIVFGLFWGTVISWAGEIIGAIVMFIFARYFFRQPIEKRIVNSPYLKQVDDYSAKNGFKALLIARLLPLAPSGIITAVAAISRISVSDFFWATVLGKLPPVVIKVILGHDLVYAGENMTRLWAIVILVVLVYVYIWWRKKKTRQNL